MQKHHVPYSEKAKIEQAVYDSLGSEVHGGRLKDSKEKASACPCKQQASDWSDYAHHPPPAIAKNSSTMELKNFLHNSPGLIDQPSSGSS